MGTFTRSSALLVVFGLAGCSAPGVQYPASYAPPQSPARYAHHHPQHHHATEVARSTTHAREQVADLGDAGSRGVASFYSGRAATGENVGSHELTAAHRSLPFGTKVRVTNLKNGRSVTVRINDRGPFVRNRAIDLSDGAAGALDMKRAGVAPVRMEVVR